jgi:hypothetical protein
MITPSRPTAPVQDWEKDFQARVRAVDPERLEEFLHSLRWVTASRDPKVMRVLTEASRVFGALRLESIAPR